MILQQLSPRIFYLPANHELDRPTLGYINGDNYSVMIDCGTSKAHLELFNLGLAERNLPLPTVAIITHWHWDHTFGMHAFHGQTIANYKTHTRLSIMKKWTWTDDVMKTRLETGEEIPFCDTHIRLEYPNTQDITIVTPDIIFDRELRLDLGGIHCEITMVDWQHAEDSNIIYIPEEKVYFVGDADSEDFYHNQGKYHKQGLENIISFWEKQDFHWHIHGHLPPHSKKDILAYFNKQRTMIESNPS